ncbi:MAG: TldD/PmbA family protein [Coriobacteriia bacterium]|nr:TldD/PmbA family protein [Coriobacteriia bacterium]
MITTQRANELAAVAVAAALDAGADQAEALVMASESALTRFANNHIHQNVASEDGALSVRAVIGTRVGVASTNRNGAGDLRACAERAVAAARRAPADPDFPGLPGSHPVISADRVAPGTLDFGPAERARAAGAIIAASSSRGLTAAGTVAASSNVIAIANSLGVDAAMALTSSRATVLSMGPDGGSGWASFAGRDASELDAIALGARAADTAIRSASAIELEAGVYTVVLAPEAVADIATFLGWYGCSAKAVEEGRSFMSGRIGQRICSEAISLIDDALAPDSVGLTFDYEGQPKTRTPLIERGIAVGPVTDSYWAARTGRPNTGHALPAPNSFGPLPLDLRIEPGDATPADMIASVRQGIYVTRFHYTNIEDPVRAVLTGMTRDGTFLIEDGVVGRPVKNLRFTQSAVEALDSTLAVSSERTLVGEEGGALVPYLLLERFAITGQTT